MTTKVLDLIVPEVFTRYSIKRSMELSRLVRSRAVETNPVLTNLLAGGGSTFNLPSFRDLDASDATGADAVVTDDVADIIEASFENATPLDADRGDLVPDKIRSFREAAARMVRAKAWSSTALAAVLSGEDPIAAIETLVANYWVRREQRIFTATWRGIIANNLLAPAGGSTHTQFDLVEDVSGASFMNGVTNFTPQAFIAAKATAGDALDQFAILMVHSTVYARMQNLNLIDFIEDSESRIRIPVYMDHEVIVDDGVPVNGNIYDSLIFGVGATQMGVVGGAGPDSPGTEVDRKPLAGQGGGQTILVNRRQYIMHPIGHRYVQSSIPDGGPSNANVATATSWIRVYPERKQVPFAVLRTREA